MYEIMNFIVPPNMTIKRKLLWREKPYFEFFLHAANLDNQRWFAISNKLYDHKGASIWSL